MIEIPQVILDGQRRQEMEDVAGREAASRPFPGTTKEAFNLFPEIQVADFKVRPFYDGDFDILESINHPFIAWMMSNEAEKKNRLYKIQGRAAWQIMWLLTTPIEEIEKECDDGTLKDSIEKKPRKIFGRMRFEAINAIHDAIFRQVSIYWNSSAAYRDKENGEAGGSGNPPK
jgi:hypothetical protein